MAELYYHTCGYPILFETSNEGLRPSAVFEDGGQEEETPEVIDVCPGCGEVLLMGDLTAQLEDEE